jgi:hypothetical protein
VEKRKMYIAALFHSLKTKPTLPSGSAAQITRTMATDFA